MRGAGYEHVDRCQGKDRLAALEPRGAAPRACRGHQPGQVTEQPRPHRVRANRWATRLRIRPSVAADSG
eukprot:7922934-Lingulodinium_polyedra.AAC.1